MTDPTIAAWSREGDLLFQLRQLREENERLKKEIANQDAMLRLEGEIERKSDAIQRLWKERDDLRAVNAQLLEALEFIADRQDLMFAECSDAEEIIEVARAAIAAAKGGA
jgi:hypothetical protein